MACNGKVDCTVIIVTYNSASFIVSLLDSLPSAAAGLTLRVIVVDNGSTDETVKLVTGRLDVDLVVMNANLGYAGGINVGRSNAGDCSALAILNPDLVLSPSALRDLFIAVLEDPMVGVVVPMLLEPTGTLYPSLHREPTLIRAIGDALLGRRFGRRPGFLSESVHNPDEYLYRHSIDWASGAALMISANCNRSVGDWDERFFLYSEEVDFAARARATGLHIEYVPAARACHRGGGSGRSTALLTLMAVNRVRYYQKYHGRISSALYGLVVVLHYFLRAAGPEHRTVLRTLVSRARWEDVPHGDLDATRWNRERMPSEQVNSNR